AEYLREFETSGRELVGSEQAFTLHVGQALISGMADRLELRVDDTGTRRVSVVDLKTGKYPPRPAERESHAQLLSYQLGITSNALTSAPEGESWQNDGARLLYVHP